MKRDQVTATQGAFPKRGSADVAGKPSPHGVSHCYSRVMFFDSGAKHARICVADIYNLRSQAIASHMPNLDAAGKSGILGNLQINVHSIANVHGGTRQQV